MENAQFSRLKTQDNKVVLGVDNSPAYEPPVSLSEILEGDVFMKVGSPGLWRAVGDPYVAEEVWTVDAKPVKILDNGEIVADGDVVRTSFGEEKEVGKKREAEDSQVKKTLFIHNCGIILAQKVTRCPGCSVLTENYEWQTIEVYVSWAE